MSVLSDNFWDLAKAKFFVGASAFFFCSFLWAVNPLSESELEEPEPRVYEEVSYARGRSLEMLARVSMLNPSEFYLNGKNFQASHASIYRSAPGFSLGLAVPVFYWDDFQFVLEGLAGYRYKRGQFVVNPNESLPTNLIATLHEVPLSLGTTVLYSMPGFPFVKPTLSFGLGGRWISQQTSTSLFSESFWLPYFFVTPGLSFFPSYDPGDWFGGFNFGISYQQSFSVKHRVTGVSMELSLHILL